MSDEIKGVVRYGDCCEIMRRWIASGIKVNMCVTSPPYWGLRDYGVKGQFGLEKTPDEYVAKMVEVFRLVREMLQEDGTLWLNVGDSYSSNGKGGRDAEVRSRGKNIPRGSSRWGGGNNEVAGLKCKDLVGVPWMLAFALRADGWYLRSDIIWHKPNAMPESVKDRPTKAHEYIFLLSKNERYYYDADAVAEPFVFPERRYRKFTENHKTGQLALQGNRSTTGLHDGRSQYGDPEIGKNRRTVWKVPTKPFSGAHFATFPPDLIAPCILAGSPPQGIVLDPFMGSGTTAQVVLQLNRRYLGCELNPAYEPLINARIAKVSPKEEEKPMAAD